jgi:uncharacterized protein
LDVICFSQSGVIWGIPVENQLEINPQQGEVVNKLKLFLATGALLVGSIGAASALGNHPDWCDEQSSKNGAERTICATKSLWILDDELNNAYQTAEGSIGGQKSQLVSSQRNWLSVTRNGCGASVGCLTSAYRSRIRTLEDIASRGRM